MTTRNTVQSSFEGHTAPIAKIEVRTIGDRWHFEGDPDQTPAPDIYVPVVHLEDGTKLWCSHKWTGHPKPEGAARCGAKLADKYNAQRANV